MTLIKKIDNPDKIFDRENLWDSYLKVEGELALAPCSLAARRGLLQPRT